MGLEERERLGVEKVTATEALMSLGSHLNLSKTMVIDMKVDRIFGRFQ